MILSNREIHRALDDGRLRFEPEPSPRFPQTGGPVCRFDNTAVDLRLGETLYIPRENLQVAIDFARGSTVETFQALSEKISIDADSGYQLQANKLILGQTLERVQLPLPGEHPDSWPNGRLCLAARVEGKSSCARFGLLIHFTAPTIHAGFHGHIALEIINLGPTPIVLRRHMYICQLIFEEVLSEPTDNPSQFENQSTPTGGT